MKRNTLQGSSSIGAGCLFIIIILFIVVFFKKILWIIGGAVGLWLLYKTVSYLISERDDNDNHYIYQDDIELFNTRKEKKAFNYRCNIVISNHSWIDFLFL